MSPAQMMGLLARAERTRERQAVDAEVAAATAMNRIDLNVASMFRLTGKVALVTGAGSGIGRGISNALGSAGAKVVLMGRDTTELETVAQEIRRSGGEALCVVADVTDDAALDAALSTAKAKFGPISILVNNAGIANDRTLFETTREGLGSVLDVNVTSPLILAQKVVPHMREAGGGSIINIGSTTTSQGSGAFGEYAASKGAIGALTKSWAKALAHLNINVNMMVPGFVRTPMGSWTNQPGMEDLLESEIPQGHLAEPEDLGPLAVFLAGWDGPARYITGAAYAIDGGIMDRDPAAVRLVMERNRDRQG